LDSPCGLSNEKISWTPQPTPRLRQAAISLSASVGQRGTTKERAKKTMRKIVVILSILVLIAVGCKNKSNEVAAITPTSNVEEVESVNIPEELLPYASFLHKGDLELYNREDFIKNLRDTTFFIKKLYYREDTKFAMVFIRFHEGGQARPTIYASFYKEIEKQWIHLDSFYLPSPSGFGGLDCKFELLPDNNGVFSCIFLADGDGQYYIFTPSKEHDKIILFNRTFYYKGTGWLGYNFGFRSEKDTIPWKGNNLPFQYKIYKENYKSTKDTFILQAGIYNSIRGGYFISQWIDFKGENGTKRISVDSIKISDLMSAQDAFNQKYGEWKQRIE
jgi:hypothetical protein